MSSLALSTNVCPDSGQFVKQQAEKHLSQRSQKIKELSATALFKEDFVIHIFKFLPLEDVNRVSSVCKQWRVLAYSADFWKTFASELGQTAAATDYQDEPLPYGLFYSRVLSISLPYIQRLYSIVPKPTIGLSGLRQF